MVKCAMLRESHSVYGTLYHSVGKWSILFKECFQLVLNLPCMSEFTESITCHSLCIFNMMSHLCKYFMNLLNVFRVLNKSKLSNLVCPRQGDVTYVFWQSIRHVDNLKAVQRKFEIEFSEFKQNLKGYMSDIRYPSLIYILH